MPIKKSVSNSDTLNTVEEGNPAAAPAEAADSATLNTADSSQAAAPTEAATPAADNERYTGITNFVYVGPSLPGGRLKSLTTLNGTYTQIMDYYQETIALFPNVARLIVPVTRLAEAREKIQKGGNLMYNYYHQVTANIQAKGDEQ